jgi:hypothetical protein
MSSSLSTISLDLVGPRTAISSLQKIQISQSNVSIMDRFFSHWLLTRDSQTPRCSYNIYWFCLVTLLNPLFIMDPCCPRVYVLSSPACPLYNHLMCHQPIPNPHPPFSSCQGLIIIIILRRIRAESSLHLCQFEFVSRYTPLQLLRHAVGQY